MRLFLAIELPEVVKHALIAVQDQLRPARPPVAWVAPQAMHLTLVFLGETDAALLPDIGVALGAASGHAPFELRLAETGVFPNLRRPQVLWVGVGGALAALGDLQRDAALALEPLGVPRESRPYSPHLTLGRVRRDAPPDERTRLGDAVRSVRQPEEVAWQVDHVTLFESQLRPGGPIYSARDTIALAKR